MQLSESNYHASGDFAGNQFEFNGGIGGGRVTNGFDQVGWYFRFVNAQGVTVAECTTDFGDPGQDISDYLSSSPSECSYFPISGSFENPIIEANEIFARPLVVHYSLNIKNPASGEVKANVASGQVTSNTPTIENIALTCFDSSFQLSSMSFELRDGGLGAINGLFFDIAIDSPSSEVNLAWSTLQFRVKNSSNVVIGSGLGSYPSTGVGTYQDTFGVVITDAANLPHNSIRLNDLAGTSTYDFDIDYAVSSGDEFLVEYEFTPVFTTGGVSYNSPKVIGSFSIEASDLSGVGCLECSRFPHTSEIQQVGGYSCPNIYIPSFMALSGNEVITAVIPITYSMEPFAKNTMPGGPPGGVSGFSHTYNFQIFDQAQALVFDSTSPGGVFTLNFGTTTLFFLSGLDCTNPAGVTYTAKYNSSSNVEFSPGSLLSSSVPEQTVSFVVTPDGTGGCTSSIHNNQVPTETIGVFE